MGVYDVLSVLCPSEIHVGLSNPVASSKLVGQPQALQNC